MIKANELRIGNYAQINPAHVPAASEIKPLQIASIGKNSGVAFEDDTENSYEFHEIYPILLSENLLKKVWFLKEKAEWGDEHNYLLNTLTFYIENGLVLKVYAGTSRQIPCLYLHQFQNLYFALLGEELEISF